MAEDLTTDMNGIVLMNYIGVLTDLQTVPDNYTNHVSNTQRYKMLGNGWTVEVIKHILQGDGV